MTSIKFSDKIFLFLKSNTLQMIPLPELKATTLKALDEIDNHAFLLVFQRNILSSFFLQLTQKK